MRIAVVGSRGVPGVHGGVERHCEELYPRLVRRGCEVVLFGREGYAERQLWQGVDVRPVRALRHRALEAASATRAALRRARREEFDIVHVHSIGPAASLGLVSGRSAPALVVTIHARDYLQSKWGRVGRWYLRRGEKAACRTADATITVSESLGTYLSREYPGSPVRVIPNGPGGDGVAVPMSRFGVELGLRQGRYALFVGRLIPDKRVEDLLAACVDWPEDVKVVIAGDSSYTDEYVSRLRHEAARRVVFPGYVYGRDLAELYSNAGVFVLPSAVEGMPIALLEAMSYGIPVVVSDIDANLEVLGDPPAGIVAPLGDVRSIARSVSQVLEDPGLGKRLGGAARGRVEAAYDWETIADETMQVYESLVADGGPYGALAKGDLVQSASTGGNRQHRWGA